MLTGCGESLVAGSDSETGAPAQYDAPGPYPVGNTTLTMTDSARQRTLSVEMWYPASESARARAESGTGVENFFPAGSLRDDYAALLAAAASDGPSRVAHAARDAAAEPSQRRWPLVLFSHCHECVRFSSFAIAERLASHGIAVAAPDHARNTLFDRGARLNPQFLRTRAADIRFVTDVLLRQADGGTALPAQLSERFDGDRLGVFGHSFGGVTTGLVLQDDPRFRAGASIAAPPENPLLPGVKMTDIHQPLLLLVAREDNSILEVGNEFIRDDFAMANPPAWKVEVADAGHWSFSDICGLTPAFSAGCGEGLRQTRPGEPFHYLPIGAAVGIAQRYVTAFFAAQLLGDSDALSLLAEARPEEVVSVQQR
jgi:predicted dienelactone hydrolase